MTTVRSAKQIQSPHERVWPLIEDFANVHRINPFIKSSSATSLPGTCAVGDTRRCEFYNGKSFVEEEVVDIDDGRSITIKIIAGTMPFKEAVATIEAIPVSKSQTRLTMTMDFKAKGGPIVGLLMKPMMFIMLGKLLKSVDRHLQTGQIIGKNGRLVPA